MSDLLHHKQSYHEGFNDGYEKGYNQALKDVQNSVKELAFEFYKETEV